uniref:Uncharacterized protein n=1 Tax=Anguilla anguilla TaxID=7936 RepID=A0A0E9R3T2_ANGAN
MQFVFGRLTSCELDIPKTKSTSQKIGCDRSEEELPEEAENRVLTR